MYTHDDMNNRRHISTHSHIHIKHNYTNRYRLFWVLRIFGQTTELPGAKKTRGEIRAREGHQASGHQRADETQAPIFTWKSYGNPYVIEGILWVLHGHDGHESKKHIR